MSSLEPLRLDSRNWDMTECRRCFSSVSRGPELPGDGGLVTFVARRRLRWADESDGLFWKWHCYEPEGKYQYDFRIPALRSTAYRLSLAVFLKI